MIKPLSRRSLSFALASLSATLLAAPLAHEANALDQIIRQYQGIRSSGMGGVRITTGQYDENFFNNPARVTANPRTKVVILGAMAEVAGVSNVSDVISASDKIKSLGNTAGNNTHVRQQLQIAGVYIAPHEERNWGLGVGLFTSTQADVALRRNYQIPTPAIVDIGPAVTFGYQFLEKKLSVGLTGHVSYRAALSNFSIIQLLTGKTLALKSIGKQGMMLDFDLGGTYELPLLLESPFRINVGASVNNLLGGGFSNLGNGFIPESAFSCASGCRPPSSPRNFGFGGSLNRKEWGVFTDTAFAFEVTDIGANSNWNQGGDSPNENLYGHGSLFRSLHLGGETHWRFIALRAGINQGYLTAGLGFDFRFVTLDFSTYGEEMSLNTGGKEDRRFAFQLGFQI